MISIERYEERIAANTSDTEEGRCDWKPRAGDYLKRVRVIYLILKHPKSPILAKAVAALSIGYVFSPIQLIPSFIPIIGWLDDFAVLSAGTWLLVRLTPTEVIRQCQHDAATPRSTWPREEGATRRPRTWRFLQ
jgi:uncharacterized membrane protein YkvA (DUF1232 family)